MNRLWASNKPSIRERPQESGGPDGLVHLVRKVRKFLRQFRPDEGWSLSYAISCAAPRVGDFSGGAVLVTAEEVRWENAYDFIDQARAEFDHRQAVCTSGDMPI